MFSSVSKRRVYIVRFWLELFTKSKGCPLMMLTNLLTSSLIFIHLLFDWFFTVQNTEKAAVVKSTIFIHIPNKYQNNDLVLSTRAITRNSYHGCQKLYTISTRRCVLSNYCPVGVNKSFLELDQCFKVPRVHLFRWIRFLCKIIKVEWEIDLRMNIVDCKAKYLQFVPYLPESH